MQLYETLTGKEVDVSETTHANYASNYLFAVWGAKTLVKNEKDLPLMHMVLNNFIFTVIAVACVWYSQSHVLGLAYLLAAYLIFFGRYMCLNHEYAHIQLFKNKRLGDIVSIFVIGHSYGLPVGSYYIQHIIMHHKGSNVWGVDFSSTEKYNRESIMHFMHYWLRRYSPVGFVFDAVRVCAKHNKYELAIMYGSCAICWFYLAIHIVAFTRYWKAGLWTMLLPILCTSLFGAIGGWMQHFFLNPQKPRKWFSYDLINSHANSNGFNQGFHNVHHTLGNLHWTELPSGFMTLLRDYDKDNVMIMQGVDNVQVVLLIFAKQYKVLARHLVTTKPGGHSMDHCVQYIRSHLKPVTI